MFVFIDLKWARVYRCFNAALFLADIDHTLMESVYEIHVLPYRCQFSVYETSEPQFTITYVINDGSFKHRQIQNYIALHGGS